LFDQVDANSLKFSVLTLPFSKIRFSKKKRKKREARLVITFEHTKGTLDDKTGERLRYMYQININNKKPKRLDW
jgi:hypothetical protein